MRTYHRYLPRYPIFDMKTLIRYNPDIQYLEPSASFHRCLRHSSHEILSRLQVGFANRPASGLDSTEPDPPPIRPDPLQQKGKPNPHQHLSLGLSYKHAATVYLTRCYSDPDRFCRQTR